MRNRLENGALALMALGALAMMASAGFLLLHAGDAAHYGAPLAALAVACITVGVVMAHGLDTFHGPLRAPEGTQFERLRRHTGLRVVALLLNLLIAASLLLALLGILVRTGLAQANEDTKGLERILSGFVVAFIADVLAAFIIGMRAAVPRSRPLTPFLLWLGAAVTLALAALSAGIALDLPIGLRESDAHLVLLVALAALGTLTLASRGLPGLTRAVEEPAEAHGDVLVSRRMGAFLPMLLSFGLLFLLFFVLVLLGVGVTDLFDQATSDPLLLATVVFLAVAIIASGVAVLTMMRQDHGPDLYQTKMDPKRKQELLLLSSTGVLAGLLLVGAFMTYLRGGLGPLGKDRWLDLGCLSLLVFLGPYGFYVASEHRRVRRMEERFPDLLRDLAASHRGGLTLTSAVTIAAHGEYGPLTPEIRKMSDQISWNVSFREALQRFAVRVHTPLVERAVGLILEADRSGGSTVEVLLAAARDAREIKTLENERRLSMSLYTVVVYVTFFVFLVVVAVLYGQFVPEVLSAQERAAQVGADATIFSGGGASAQDFQLFYFLAAAVQAVGDGIVAGMLSHGRARMGIRHSFWLLLFTYVAFRFFLA